MTDGNRQWLLASRPEGTPTMENFELVETAVPEPAPGEVVVRTLYLSVDPYMRGRMRDAESYAEPWNVGEPMQAGVVGEVVEANTPDYEPGTLVTGQLEWADYSTASPSELREVDPDVAPITTALGVLGLTGLTAYFGLLEVGEPNPGDTVVVSGAAGAVGSVVGQIAKLDGCRVVGTAGSDAKTEFLTEELGFDAAINYKTTEDIRATLAEATPNGVDVYFDNVGGEITDAVFDRLNVDARVAVCGQIALYNLEERPTGPRKLGTLIQKRAKVEGLLVSDFATRWSEAGQRLGRWVAEGKLTNRETVTDGLENAPGAFLGLFEGENVGKQLVKVAERTAE